MGAVVGKREFMEPAADMFLSSSYWSDNIGITASITTIRELKRRNSPARFKEIGEGIRAAVKDALDDVGISGDVVGLFNSPRLELDLPDESLRPKVTTLFIQEMAKRGVHTSGGFMATLAHTEEDIRITADAARESLEVIRKGLEGSIEDLLEAKEKREAIQRIVR